jgi:hypothetical protein
MTVFGRALIAGMVSFVALTPAKADMRDMPRSWQRTRLITRPTSS